MDNTRVSRHVGIALGVLAAAAFLGMARADQPENDEDHSLELTSTAFIDNGTLPPSAIFNFPVNGVNVCTADGGPGGDQSPPLAWARAPHRTRSFVVVLYDTTAAFTHWGMYNISATASGLPANAGVTGSSLGAEVNNDFGDPSYDGPCPPAGVPPDVHHYVFTVYALDTRLHLSSSANFPSNGETLYQALIDAGREGHILASASLTGLFSSTPP